jgi:hypothetical protein
VINTINAHRIGKTGARARVTILLALDDPKAWGNNGLEGLDEHIEVRLFPNAGLARAWCAKYAKKMEAESERYAGAVADVEVLRWDESTFYDEGYGMIRDADEVIVSTQYGGTMPTTGTWAWDDPFEKEYR